MLTLEALVSPLLNIDDIQTGQVLEAQHFADPASVLEAAVDQDLIVFHFNQFYVLLPIVQGKVSDSAQYALRAAVRWTGICQFASDLV